MTPLAAASHSLPSTPHGPVQGRISKHYGLNSELFSALLEGPAGAGTAVLSVSPATGSIHANILFRGIVKEGQVGQQAVCSAGVTSLCSGGCGW